MSADRALVTTAIAQIEAEMRRLGLWDITPISAEQRRAAGAFGMASMSFTQWLRWVFVPRVNALLASGAALPEHSAVGAQAAREWGFSPIEVDTSRLESLLAEFDANFD
jgi:uncharacterized protein YqcC (DUF446 family)